MKTNLIKRVALAAALSFTPLLGYTQGTFLYDQQSSDESNLGGGASNIQMNQPIGQSFTPQLSSVEFVRLYLTDSVFDGLGATIRVNLRADSITGSVLGSSDAISVSDRFVGPANFFFSSSVPVSPGTIYYFQPEVVSGGLFSVYAYNSFGYAGGTAYSQGVAVPGWDLWFREGIVVPEPGTWALLLIGLGVFAWRKRLFR
jgi:hypothetical protein